MSQMRNALPGSGIRNLGGFELLPDVAGSQAEFEPAIGEQIGVNGVAGK